jgi:endonuclease YncB( thermonuclease family)
MMDGALKRTLARMMALLAVGMLAGCMGWAPPLPASPPPGAPAGESARVLSVTDGDTIRVLLDGESVPVRYLGVNTPERDEPCYAAATGANAALVAGQTVTLVRDRSDTDRFGRLLRYVYVGDVLVNRELVRGGYAEVVLYAPDRAHYDEFRALEAAAAAQGLGCHPSGIFDDGDWTR